MSLSAKKAFNAKTTAEKAGEFSHEYAATAVASSQSAGAAAAAVTTPAALSGLCWVRKLRKLSYEVRIQKLRRACYAT